VIGDPRQDHNFGARRQLLKLGDQLQRDACLARALVAVESHEAAERSAALGRVVEIGLQEGKVVDLLALRALVDRPGAELLLQVGQNLLEFRLRVLRCGSPSRLRQRVETDTLQRGDGLLASCTEDVHGISHVLGEDRILS
jgi:hypothetical protein